MKIFCVASKRGKARFLGDYRRIYKHLEKLGHKPLDDWIIKDVDKNDKDDYSADKKESLKRYEQVFDDALAKLREADVNLFECSEQSFTVGYLVQKSLELNKPTVVLYEEIYQPSYFLLGSQDEKLIKKSYKDDTLEIELEKALDEAMNVADKRFNFFISP